MLKIESQTVNHLNNKMFSVHVTNVCNLACGGCDQFCGYFNKEKHFFITLSELRNNIKSFQQYRKDNWSKPDFPPSEKVFLLYGGEPTLHPEFDELLEVLYEYEDIPFVIYTNGRTFVKQLYHLDLTTSCRDISKQVYTSDLPRSCYPKHKEIFRRFHTCHRNVAYRIDYKTKEVRGEFAATLCSPCDMEGNPNPDRLEYWKRAKNICYKWTQCENSIYRNKAYCCNVAASMDHMFHNGEHGWDITEGENPFAKSEKDVNDQMSHFCYRCGYNCLGGLEGFKETMDRTQYIHHGSLITKTNQHQIDRNSPNAHRLESVNKPQHCVPPEVYR